MTWRILLFVPALAVGFGAYVLINRGGPEPSTGNGARPLVPVRVTEVVLDPVAVSVTGYGRVEPVRTGEGISQVDGQISTRVEIWVR